MQKIHRFPLTSSYNKFDFFAQECYKGYRNPKKIIMITISIITIVDLLLQWLLYPSLEDGTYPFNLITIVFYTTSIFFYVLSLSGPLNYTKPWSIRFKIGLHLLSASLYLIYLTKNILDYLHISLHTNTPKSWALTVIALSDCIHLAILIAIVAPTWYIKVFAIMGCYIGIVISFVKADHELKAWMITKSVVNLSFVTILLFLASQFRWNIFLKQSDSEAWNSIYQRVLDKISSSVVIIDGAGKSVYMNSMFKKLNLEYGEQLFSSMYGIRVKDSQLTHAKKFDSLNKKGSNTEEVTTNRNGCLMPDSPSVRLKINEPPSSSTERFQTLADLIGHYQTFLKNRRLKSNEESVYEARIQKKTLLQEIVIPYEIKVQLDIESRKIVLILNSALHNERIVLLEENIEEKDKQIEIFSNQLKSPLNRNLSLLQAAAQESSIPRSIRDKFIIPAQRSGKILLHLLNDILDYSKIQSGNILLCYELKSITKSLEYCYQLLQPSFQAKNIKLSLAFDPSLPKSFRTDHKRVIQIVLNLLNNALRTIAAGRVEIEAVNGLIPGVVEIKISDTGHGMSNDDILNLLEEDDEKQYSAKQSSRDFKYMDTGLRMANKLATMLSPRMDQGIQVTSHLGRGSSFSFKVAHQNVEGEKVTISNESKLQLSQIPSEGSINSVPDVPSELVSENDMILKDLKYPRNKNLIHNKTLMKKAVGYTRFNTVLIVDDELTNCLALKNILGQFQMNADFAFNGKEALEKMLSQPLAYGLVFMDCQMPVMNGYDATKRLIEKMNDGIVPTLPIIGCIGIRDKDKIEDCVRCGMTDVVVKPFVKENVIETIQKCSNVY